LNWCRIWCQWQSQFGPYFFRDLSPGL
jgi:hypothetical protein